MFTSTIWSIHPRVTQVGRVLNADHSAPGRPNRSVLLTHSRRSNRIEIERLRIPSVSKGKRRLILCLGALSLMGVSVRGGPITPSNFGSNATVISFDDLTGGNCNLCGPSVTNQYGVRGVTFNNTSFPGQV